MVIQNDEGLAAALVPPLFEAAHLKEFRNFERSCALFFRHHVTLFNSDQEKSDFIASRLADGPTQDQFYKRWPSYESLENTSFSEVMSFLRSQCSPKGGALCEIAKLWFSAQQQPGQLVKDFLAYLRALEADLPTNFESNKALRFLTGLRPEIQNEINEGDNDYPLTTKYILERAEEHEKRYYKPAELPIALVQKLSVQSQLTPKKSVTPQRATRTPSQPVQNGRKTPVPITNGIAITNGSSHTNGEASVESEVDEEEPMEIDSPSPEPEPVVPAAPPTKPKQTNGSVRQPHKPVNNGAAAQPVNGASVPTQPTANKTYSTQLDQAMANSTLKALLNKERQNAGNAANKARPPIQIELSKSPANKANGNSANNGKFGPNMNSARLEALNIAAAIKTKAALQAQAVAKAKKQTVTQASPGSGSGGQRRDSDTMDQSPTNKRKSRFDEQCRRCQSPSHTVHNCPLRPGSSGAALRYEDDPPSPRPARATTDRYDSYKPSWDQSRDQPRDQPSRGQPSRETRDQSPKKVVSDMWPEWPPQRAAAASRGRGGRAGKTFNPTRGGKAPRGGPAKAKYN